MNQYYFWQHRGGYEEAMATQVPVNSKEDIWEEIGKILTTAFFLGSRMEIKWYAKDTRRKVGDQDVYLVSVSDFGPIGFTNLNPEWRGKSDEIH